MWLFWINVEQIIVHLELEACSCGREPKLPPIIWQKENTFKKRSNKHKQKELPLILSSCMSLYVSGQVNDEKTLTTTYLLLICAGWKPEKQFDGVVIIYNFVRSIMEFEPISSYTSNCPLMAHNYKFRRIFFFCRNTKTDLKLAAWIVQVCVRVLSTQQTNLVKAIEILVYFNFYFFNFVSINFSLNSSYSSIICSEDRHNFADSTPVASTALQWKGQKGIESHSFCTISIIRLSSW